MGDGEVRPTEGGTDTGCYSKGAAPGDPWGHVGDPWSCLCRGARAQGLLPHPCLEQELSSLAGPEGAPGRGALGLEVGTTGSPTAARPAP